MENQITNIETAAVSAGLGIVISDYWKETSWLIIALVVFIFLDVVTGLLKAWKNGDISSAKSREGVIHKASEILALLVGFAADIFLPQALSQMTGTEIHFEVFGAAIACYIILTEILSILENLAETGVALPDFIVRRLKSYKDQIGTTPETKE